MDSSLFKLFSINWYCTWDFKRLSHHCNREETSDRWEMLKISEFHRWLNYHTLFTIMWSSHSKALLWEILTCVREISWIHRWRFCWKYGYQVNIQIIWALVKTKPCPIHDVGLCRVNFTLCGCVISWRQMISWVSFGRLHIPAVSAADGKLIFLHHGHFVHETIGRTKNDEQCLLN